MKLKDMMVYLEGTDLSEETKTAICELIQANNAAIKKEISDNDPLKKAMKDAKRKGLQF